MLSTHTYSPNCVPSEVHYLKITGNGDKMCNVNPILTSTTLVTVLTAFVTTSATVGSLLEVTSMQVTTRA